MSRYIVGGLGLWVDTATASDPAATAVKQKWHRAAMHRIGEQLEGFMLVSRKHFTPAASPTPQCRPRPAGRTRTR
jgi:hypothetical protein